jgi:eukaryotic-like serine/threonine-protein kinase
MEDQLKPEYPTEQLTVRSRILKIPGLKLIKKIGVGGMSTVWKAWDIANQRLVAVKILNREFAERGEDVRAFRAEERNMEKLRHPGIVEAYDFNNGNGNWFLVMEYVDGYTFADLLKRKQHVKEEDCLLICQSVAVALDYAWNDFGIVHCDIKPENIMVNTEGEVKLTDLGISYEFKDLKDGVKEVPDHVTGTPAYISPEQIYGDVELDCRTDIYSLGATLYHLATGRVLFPGLDNDATMRAHCDEATQARDPRLYRPELSQGFAQLLEAMLVKNRDDRITTWTDVYNMCKDIENGVIFKPRPTAGASSILLAN